VRSVRLTLAAAAVCVVVVALDACGGSNPPVVTVSGQPESASAPASTGLQQSFVAVIRHVAPTVVQISTPQGLGSGVVFDDRGDVVTNAHVVAGGGPLVVSDFRGRAYRATLVGSFAPDDLAVVRAKGASLRGATFAASGVLQVGDIVLAIGNPLGLRSSVTDGIVSALGRTVGEPNGVVLPDVIQTSAPINPGNSGGALVDLQGQVVGIPTLAATDPELGGSAAPGIGFAIPSSLLLDVAGQIVRYGHVVESHRAFLGIGLATAPASGAAVASVQRGGPAARAGIVPGAIITSLDGQPITSPVDVATVLATLAPGRTVTVGITKPDGSSTTVKVRLGQYPGSGA
jgi:S1-C subfamily serine protease